MEWNRRLSLFVAGRAEGEDLLDLLRIAERAEQFDDELQRTVQKALDEVVGPTEAALSQWQTVAKARAEEIERLRAALKPFADLSRAYLPREPSDESAYPWGGAVPYIADLHRAADALSGTPKETTS